MGQAPWGDSATEGLLALAAELISGEDPRGLPLLRLVLTRECGPAFAETVVRALAAGTPPTEFQFLPSAGAGPPRRTTPTPVHPPSHRPDFQSAEALPNEGYASVAQVAAHFGVSVKAVYRWMDSGRIQAERRPGGSYRIPVAQFRP